MALYLGDKKVSPSLNTVVIRTQNTSGQVISQTIDTNYTMEDPDNLAIDQPIAAEWTRPSGWPDLDSLPALTEGVYLTYDNTSKVDYKWASFICWMNTGSYRVALGHMNGSSWVLDTYWDIASGNYKEVDYSGSAYSSYNYLVFKITPASTNHINLFYFARIPQATLGTYALRQLQDQHCLERVGKLPYLTTTAGSGEAYRYCTEWIERDKVKFGDSLTSLNCAWYRGRRLLKLEFDGWTGVNCNITNLAYAFEYCHEIEELDLSSWQTTNWHISTLQEMFYCCFRLKKLNLNWNTTNWGATSGRTITLNYMFTYCEALELLDLNSWDVSQWNNTGLYLTWAYCYHLRSLKVNNWNTTNWHVNTLYETWDLCFNLIDIDLSGWDTTNWTVTNLAYTFRSNLRRRNFNDIVHWNTANWRPTTMYAMFDSCYAIRELDLSNWDVSEWPCTSLSATWAGCRSMRSLKVGTWNMSKTDKWKVTSIYAIFLNCYSLEDTEFFNWNTKNWTITSVGYAFYGCFKLKEIDLTTYWANATWNIINDPYSFIYFAGYCHSVRKIDISRFNLSAITTLNYYGNNTTTTTNFYECQNLETLNLPSTFKGRLNFRYNYLMSRTEIVKIFNALPTAISGATIVLTEMRYKLTNADIAIATNKGYTVS